MPDETTPQDPSSEEPTEAPATDATAPTPAAAPAPAASGERKGVFVPRWLAVLLGLVLAVALVGGGGFALGRATADDHHDDHRARVDDRRQGGQGGPGNQGDRQGGQPGGQGDRQDRGNVPTPRGDQPTPTGRVLLGVTVEPAGDGGTGARIVDVSPGSPAADAGLESGDVITKVDDAAVDGPQALASAIQEHADGDEVTLTYEREGTTATAKVTLAAQAPSSIPRTSPPA
jgi:membrane-associated protease RseP (regulator of RpoE activity)